MDQLDSSRLAIPARLKHRQLTSAFVSRGVGNGLTRGSTGSRMHFIQSLWGGIPLQIRIVLSGSCPLASNETLAAYYYPMHTSCQIIKIMRVHLHCLRATVDSHTAHRLANVVHFPLFRLTILSLSILILQHGCRLKLIPSLWRQAA